MIPLPAGGYFYSYNGNDSTPETPLKPIGSVFAAKQWILCYFLVESTITDNQAVIEQKAAELQLHLFHYQQLIIISLQW